MGRPADCQTFYAAEVSRQGFDAAILGDGDRYAWAVKHCENESRFRQAAIIARWSTATAVSAFPGFACPGIIPVRCATKDIRPESGFLAIKSTTTVTIRSLVMLAFLVFVPVVAMFGDTVFGPLAAIWDDGPREEATSAPFFGDPLRWRSTAAESNDRGAPLYSQAQQDEPFRASGDRPEAQGETQPPKHEPLSQIEWTPKEEGFGSPLPRSVVSAEAIGRAEPLKYDSGRGPDSQQGLGFSAEPVADGPFERIERRLRELGATYYRLETWGSDGRSYRFYCQMGPATATSRPPTFEAIDHRSLGAMQRVLADIEAWLGLPAPRN